MSQPASHSGRLSVISGADSRMGPTSPMESLQVMSHSELLNAARARTRMVPAALQVCKRLRCSVYQTLVCINALN